jgi:hypothetical protein
VKIMACNAIVTCQSRSICCRPEYPTSYYQKHGKSGQPREFWAYWIDRHKCLNDVDKTKSRS